MAENIQAEEYRQKWEYVRHAEKMQNTAIHWYLLITGGILTFIFTKSSDAQKQYGDLAFIVPLIFLVIYGLTLNWLLITMKRNRDRYMGRIQEIDGNRVIPRDRGLIFWAFFYRYLAPTLVGAGIAFLLSLAGMTDDLNISCMDKWWKWLLSGVAVVGYLKLTLIPLWCYARNRGAYND